MSSNSHIGIFSLVCFLFPFVCTSLLKPVIIDFCQMTLSTDRAKVRTELGKQAFMFSVPAAWNQLQTDWLLQELILIRAFRNEVKVLKADSKRVRNGCLLFLSVFFKGCCTLSETRCCSRVDQGSLENDIVILMALI